MRKQTAKGLLAVALSIAVCILATQAVGHWHDNPLDEQHCQVCHVGHAAIPQPAVQAATQTPVPTARFAPTNESSHDLKAIRTPSVPRAPPA